MNILVDIAHPAHINFFKPIIRFLNESGHSVMITYLDRGSISVILEKEMPELPGKCVGRHRGTWFSIVFEANIIKFFRLLFLTLKMDIRLGLSVGGFTLGMALKLQGKPNIQFDDDPERKANFFLERVSSSILILPPIVRHKRGIRLMNALKEWSYLNPELFNPEPDVLNEYGLIPYSYIFVREIDNRSLNYKDQLPNSIAGIASGFPGDMKVVLSLEDKTARDLYPQDWILLAEPVRGIHSLMYYSKFVISSGDSMAREGALLGTPSIYCGIRQMQANNLIAAEHMFFHLSPDEIPEFIDQYEMNIDQKVYRNELNNKWDNITRFTMNQIRALL